MASVGCVVDGVGLAVSDGPVACSDEVAVSVGDVAVSLGVPVDSVGPVVGAGVVVNSGLADKFNDTNVIYFGNRYIHVLYFDCFLPNTVMLFKLMNLGTTHMFNSVYEQ